jgi:hypothetical protein
MAAPSIAPEVIGIVEVLWGSPADRDLVTRSLAMYGQASYEREVSRVQLAVLKLCEGATDRVPDLVAAARRDYRDVLMWAEYPEEGRSMWTIARDLSLEEQERLAAVRRRDRVQYEQWLAELRQRAVK